MLTAGIKDPSSVPAFLLLAQTIPLLSGAVLPCNHHSSGDISSEWQPLFPRTLAFCCWRLEKHGGSCCPSLSWHLRRPSTAGNWTSAVSNWKGRALCRSFMSCKFIEEISYHHRSSFGFDRPSNRVSGSVRLFWNVSYVVRSSCQDDLVQVCWRTIDATTVWRSLRSISSSCGQMEDGSPISNPIASEEPIIVASATSHKGE
jgi:hypothetical protein